VIDLETIQERAKAATPGPWRQGNVERDRIFVDHPNGLGTDRVLLRMNEHFDNHVADAAYIDAANPSAILELIALLHDQASQAKALARRRDELLVTIRNLSQSTPLPDELAGWERQRAALVAEVGTLKARVAELERQRDDAQAQSNRDLEARRNAQWETEWMAPIVDAARAWSRGPACDKRAAMMVPCAPGCRECDALEGLARAIDDAKNARIAVVARTGLETQDSIEEWRRDTFGVPSTAARLAARANVEMAELLDELSAGRNEAAAVECADVVIVLFGVAERLGVDLLAEVDKKMAINRDRKWTVAGDGTGKHVRDKSEVKRG
jgi:NTP pyrophosphatase (non-canonical NTP hydrolase)